MRNGFTRNKETKKQRNKERRTWDAPLVA
eukprot:SAG31_NODE_23527_length_502_cov_1.019851_1_plen_28_part_10